MLSFTKNILYTNCQSNKIWRNDPYDPGQIFINQLLRIERQLLNQLPALPPMVYSPSAAEQGQQLGDKVRR